MQSVGSSTTTFSTFLFTDIEGSSTRWLNHRAAMERAVPRHDALIREVTAQFRAMVEKQGLLADYDKTWSYVEQSMTRAAAK